MGLITNLKERFQSTKGFASVQLVSEQGENYYSWDGKLYESDIVRSCVRPKAQAIGKIYGKHIRDNGKGKVDVNTVPYLRFLLSDPNPYMSGQILQEKMATQASISGNAFALIIRDDNGLPTQVYPINAIFAEALYRKDELLIRFTLKNGQMKTFSYSDILHIRCDVNENDIFGSSRVAPIMETMNVVGTLDTGIINAVKNSGIIRWLLISKSSLRPEDLKKNVQDFVKNYMSVEGDTFGAAGIDAKFEAKQVNATNVMPDSSLTDQQMDRVYRYFNTNKKIVTSDYSEEEWNSYYNAEIEPMVLQFSQEWTRKLFSKRERSSGNSIVFEAINLQCATLKTKLSLQAMVDRGAMLPDEWRHTLNLSNIPGGDKPIRRLDTQTVDAVFSHLSAENKAYILESALNNADSEEKEDVFSAFMALLSIKNDQKEGEDNAED